MRFHVIYFVIAAIAATATVKASPVPIKSSGAAPGGSGLPLNNGALARNVDCFVVALKNCALSNSLIVGVLLLQRSLLHRGLEVRWPAAISPSGYMVELASW